MGIYHISKISTSFNKNLKSVLLPILVNYPLFDYMDRRNWPSISYPFKVQKGIIHLTHRRKSQRKSKCWNDNFFKHRKLYKIKTKTSKPQTTHSQIAPSHTASPHHQDTETNSTRPPYISFLQQPYPTPS